MSSDIDFYSKFCCVISMYMNTIHILWRDQLILKC